MTGEADARSPGEPPTGPARQRTHRIAVVWTLLVVAASLVDPAAVLELLGVPPTTGAERAGGAAAFAVAHLLAYGVLAWLLVDGLGPDLRTHRAVIAAVALTTAVGIGVELLQIPVAARTGSAADALVNAVGATVGAGLRGAVERR